MGTFDRSILRHVIGQNATASGLHSSTCHISVTPVPTASVTSADGTICLPFFLVHSPHPSPAILKPYIAHTSVAYLCFRHGDTSVPGHVNNAWRQAAKDAGQSRISLQRQLLPVGSIVQIPMSTTHGDERPRMPAKSQGSRFPAPSMSLQRLLLPMGLIVRIPMSLLFTILEVSHGRGFGSIHVRYVFRLAPPSWMTEAVWAVLACFGVDVGLRIVEERGRKVKRPRPTLWQGWGRRLELCLEIDALTVSSYYMA